MSECLLRKANANFKLDKISEDGLSLLMYSCDTFPITDLKTN